ncbi:MAG: phosphodiester glycosidase family protein [Elusimicrobiota bacterium]
MNGRRLGLLLVLSLGAGFGCRSLPKQDGVSLAILFDLERKLPGAGMNLVRPGLIHARWVGPGPLFVNILAVDTRRSDLYFRPLLSSGRMDGAPDTWEPLDVIARRNGALAAINGDYPLGGLNVSGFTVIDGALHLAPKPPKRSSLIFSRDNSVKMMPYDASKIGSPDYHQALSGGPLIMFDGAFKWERDDTGRINGGDLTSLDAQIDAAQARTAVCLLGDTRTLYLIHVENRLEDRSGATPQRLGTLLERLKCREAMLLAGGAYSGMALKGRLLGASKNLGRPVGSALGLFEHQRP